MIVVAAKHEELDIMPSLVDEADKVIVTGVGALNVWRALQNEPRDELIVNVGYCGSNTLPIGTLCSPEEVELYHPNVSYAEKELERLDAYVNMNHAKCYTNIDFVTETKIKEPVIFDMELAFIAGMGFEHIRAVKKVSDNLSLKEYEENSK